jgi:hypothetical protein
MLKNLLSKKMTFEKVLINIRKDLYIEDEKYLNLKGLYNNHHVFDLEQTVKWNREQVIKENAIITESNEKLRESVINGDVRYTSDILECIMGDGFTKEQAKVILTYTSKEFGIYPNSNFIEDVKENMKFFRNIQTLQ